MNKDYELRLTKSQVENLAEFIEFYFIDSIRTDDGIDNIDYLVDMCDVYKNLRTLIELIDTMEG